MRGVEAAIRAIAERHRREIVRLVRDSELTAGQIASHFEVSRPAVSQHLRILKDSGLVTERRQGTRRYYKARVEGLAELRAFLEVFLGEDTWIEPRPGTLTSGASTPAAGADTEIVLTDPARPEQPVIT
jgi:DNA-binding transcriptional ArsR family regulator